jgi:nucleoside 2-deoxyribosyltransferase
MKVFVAHASNFDFKKKLYEPIRASALNAQHEFWLPQETEEDWVTLDFMKSCDALIVDVSIPSTGAGIEMGWANALGIPILGVYEKGSKPSASAEYTTSMYRDYSTSDEMLAIVDEFLSSLKKS